MIFKQIHSLPTGPNWGKIALITVGVAVAAYLAYSAVKHVKLKIAPKPSPKDKTE